MASAASLDELIRSGFGEILLVVSSEANSFGVPGAFEVRSYPKEEIIAWLEAKDVPQLLNGSYWREFADFAIHGAMETETPPGSDPIEPYFKLTVVRQSPGPLFG